MHWQLHQFITVINNKNTEESRNTRRRTYKNKITDWANHVLPTKNFVSPAVNKECLKTFTFLKSVNCEAEAVDSNTLLLIVYLSLCFSI